MHSETTVQAESLPSGDEYSAVMCFFLFMATQLFIGETGQETLVNGVNMLLYLVFVPGLFFWPGTGCPWLSGIRRRADDGV